MFTVEEMQEIVATCKFENFKFEVIRNLGKPAYLQATWTEPCIVSRQHEEQKSRKWLLSPHMTKSEIVQTCFKCALTAVEHRAREEFTYKGRRIFGPHFDVDALVMLCKHNNLDVRS